MFSRFLIKLSLFFSLFLIITVLSIARPISASGQSIQVTATVLEHITYLKNGDNLTFSTNYSKGLSVISNQGNFQRVNFATALDYKLSQGYFITVVNF